MSKTEPQAESIDTLVIQSILKSQYPRCPGVTNIETEAVSSSHPISSAEAWWAAVLGSGYRGTIDQLTEEEREQVRGAIGATSTSQALQK